GIEYAVTATPYPKDPHQAQVPSHKLSPKSGPWPPPPPNRLPGLSVGGDEDSITLRGRLNPLRVHLKMVVPKSSPGIHHDLMRSDSMMEGEGKADAGIQNSGLRVKKTLQSPSHDPGVDPHPRSAPAPESGNSMNIQPERGDLQIIPNLHSKLEQTHSEKENPPACGRTRSMDKVCSDSKPTAKEGNHCDADDSSYSAWTSAGEQRKRGQDDGEGSSGDLVAFLDETALDEGLQTSVGSPQPETEAPAKTLIGKLDQGYMSIHSALSSQSTVDSELSTSMIHILGYKPKI
ncbi:unnamed protein product, partial [Ranitomeya imitator]